MWANWGKEGEERLAAQQRAKQQWVQSIREQIEEKRRTKVDSQMREYEEYQRLVHSQRPQPDVSPARVVLPPLSAGDSVTGGDGRRFPRTQYSSSVSDIHDRDSQSPNRMRSNSVSSDQRASSSPDLIGSNGPPPHQMILAPSNPQAQSQYNNDISPDMLHALRKSIMNDIFSRLAITDQRVGRIQTDYSTFAEGLHSLKNRVELVEQDLETGDSRDDAWKKGMSEEWNRVIARMQGDRDRLMNVIDQQNERINMLDRALQEQNARIGTVVENMQRATVDGTSALELLRAALGPSASSAAAALGTDFGTGSVPPHFDGAESVGNPSSSALVASIRKDGLIVSTSVLDRRMQDVIVACKTFVRDQVSEVQNQLEAERKRHESDKSRLEKEFVDILKSEKDKIIQQMDRQQNQHIEQLDSTKKNLGQKIEASVVEFSTQSKELGENLSVLQSEHERAFREWKSALADYVQETKDRWKVEMKIRETMQEDHVVLQKTTETAHMQLERKLFETIEEVLNSIRKYMATNIRECESQIVKLAEMLRTLESESRDQIDSSNRSWKNDLFQFVTQFQEMMELIRVDTRKEMNAYSSDVDHKFTLFSQENRILRGDIEILRTRSDNRWDEFAAFQGAMDSQLHQLVAKVEAAMESLRHNEIVPLGNRIRSVHEDALNRISSLCEELRQVQSKFQESLADHRSATEARQKELRDDIYRLSSKLQETQSDVTSLRLVHTEHENRATQIESRLDAWIRDTDSKFTTFVATNSSDLGQVRAQCSECHAQCLVLNSRINSLTEQAVAAAVSAVSKKAADEAPAVDSPESEIAESKSASEGENDSETTLSPVSDPQTEPAVGETEAASNSVGGVVGELDEPLKSTEPIDPVETAQVVQTAVLPPSPPSPPSPPVLDYEAIALCVLDSHRISEWQSIVNSRIDGFDRRFIEVRTSVADVSGRVEGLEQQFARWNGRSEARLGHCESELQRLSLGLMKAMASMDDDDEFTLDGDGRSRSRVKQEPSIVFPGEDLVEVKREMERVAGEMSTFDFRLEKLVKEMENTRHNHPGSESSGTVMPTAESAVSSRDVAHPSTAEFHALNGRLDRVEQSALEAAAESTEVMISVDGVKSAIESLETRVAAIESLETRITAVESLGTRVKSIDTLEVRVAALESNDRGAHQPHVPSSSSSNNHSRGSPEPGRTPLASRTPSLTSIQTSQRRPSITSDDIPPREVKPSPAAFSALNYAVVDGGSVANTDHPNAGDGLGSRQQSASIFSLTPSGRKGSPIQGPIVADDGNCGQSPTAFSTHTGLPKPALGSVGSDLGSRRPSARALPSASSSSVPSSSSSSYAAPAQAAPASVPVTKPAMSKVPSSMKVPSSLRSRRT